MHDAGTGGIHLLNVGKKVTGKKVTEKKSQIWVGKKVTGKKVPNIFFFCFMLEIFIIINSNKTIFVWVDVLRPDYQFSVMPDGANASRVLNQFSWSLFEACSNAQHALYCSIRFPSPFAPAPCSTTAPPCPIYMY